MFSFAVNSIGVKVMWHCTLERKVVSYHYDTKDDINVYGNE